MLLDLVIKALLMVASTITPIGMNNATDVETSVHTSNDHVVTFELPSLENLIEAKVETEDLWVIDLPEVEIFATCTEVETEELWVIDLPEVEIVATYTGENRYEATLIDGEPVAIMYLDEVVITAEATR